MRLTSGYERRRARIEIVPLLDVVFLLLVFFIYAMLSMTVHRGVRVVLPAAAGRIEPMDSFVVTITSDNKVLIEGRESGIEEAVRSALVWAESHSGGVLIYGDRNADLGPAIELLSRFRTAGIDSVSFLVQEAR